MKLEIKTDSGTASAVISGEIDHHNAKELRTELDRFIMTVQPAALIMDLSGITFMDSSGIGLIIGRSKLIKECGGVLEIHGPMPYIKRVLRLAGIERIVRIVD